MSNKEINITEELIRSLPKTDLHCHLDGSLRINTMLELAEEQKIRLPKENPEDLKTLMTAGKKKKKSLSEYLDLFDITLSLLQTPDAIERVAFELAEDQSNDGVKYLEVRYSPVLHLEKGMKMTDTVDSISRGLRYAEKKFGIRTGIIICGIRSISPQISLSLAELAVAFKNRGVVGFDLAGQEENFPAKHHREAFYLTLNNNVNCTLHAGESFGPESVHQAIHYCGAHRIGHGTRLREDGDLLNYVNDHRIPLEMCITSNVQTGSVKSYDMHPIKSYYIIGLRVTINTDNLLVSDTTLSKEYMLAHQYYNFDFDDFTEIIINGFKSAFLPYREKAELVRQVVSDLENYSS